MLSLKNSTLHYINTQQKYVLSKFNKLNLILNYISKYHPLSYLMSGTCLISDTLNSKRLCQ